MSSDEIKIKAIIILDIVGRPAEHLVETLEKITEEMRNEKGIEVISKNIREPVLMKDQKDFYTTFAEIEIDVDEISYLSGLIFKYMPANIEIISPEMLIVANNKINDILNNLAIRLHSYDEIARVMQVEKQILFGKIKELGGDIPKEISPIATPFLQEQDVSEQKEQKTPKKEKDSQSVAGLEKRKDKATNIKSREKIEKIKSKEKKHTTKVKSPKQEKNNRKKYNKQSRGH